MTGARLSILGPPGGSGGHEADAGTAVAAATAATAEAAIGWKRAGDAGGAGLTHKHRASPGTPTQQVPTAHDDPGIAHVGAAGATRTLAAASREGDSTTGEGGVGDQGLRPTCHAAPGAAHGCGRKKTSAMLPCSPLQGEKTGLVASGKWPRLKWLLLSI